MLDKLLLAAALSVAVATPALAQSSSSPSNDASSMPSSSEGSGANSGANSGGMTIREHLKQDLTKSGFTDVQVMPTSFFVRAKDKNGHRVMMMIGPDSVTTITGAGMKASTNKSGMNTSGSSDDSSSQ